MHYFYDPNITEQSTQIAKSELVHFKALRIAKGERIAITNGQGLGFQAEVIDPVEGVIRIGDRLFNDSKSEIHLIQAIAKGGRDEMALQACTELGIASATALQAERSVSRWESKVSKNIDRWEQIAISAIKQSQQLRLPEIAFAGSVEELKPRGVSMVLDPEGERQIGQIEPTDCFTVAVGPEGGFSEAELEAFVKLGFQRVRLGESVLRTSSAGSAAIACLKLISGEFGQRLD